MSTPEPRAPWRPSLAAEFGGAIAALLVTWPLVMACALFTVAVVAASIDPSDAVVYWALAYAAGWIAREPVLRSAVPGRAIAVLVFGVAAVLAWTAWKGHAAAIHAAGVAALALIAGAALVPIPEGRARPVVGLTMLHASATEQTWSMLHSDAARWTRMAVPVPLLAVTALDLGFPRTARVLAFGAVAAVAARLGGFAPAVWSGDDPRCAGLAAEIALAGVFVAASFAALVRLDRVDADHGGRLVVAAQRHPWGTMCVGALATVAVGAWGDRATPGWPVFVSTDMTMVATLTLAAAACWRAPGQLERLAPLLAAAMLGSLWFEMATNGTAPVRTAAALFEATSRAAMPVVAAWAMGKVTPRRLQVVGGAALVAAAASAGLRGDAYFLWLALVPVALHVLVGTEVRGRVVVATAVAIGALWAVARDALRVADGSGDDPTTPRGLVVVVAAWALCAVVALAIRRVHSLSAVPLDHPVVQDFGGA